MKILRIKLENILAIAYTPIAVIGISKASKEMFIASIILQVLLLSGLYIGLAEVRKEILEAVKNGIIEEYKQELANYLRPIKEYIEAFKDAYKSIKKEAIKKQTKTTKLKDAF